MSDLLSVTEAQNRIISAFAPVSTEIVPLADALGRVLSLAVTAELDLPPFTNSSMDGFAIQARDIQTASQSDPVMLALVAVIPAGTAPTAPVGPGEAARIMTGAVLPAGADAVIPQEATRIDPAQPRQVLIFQPVHTGDYLRLKGSDLHSGEPVLPAGHKILPQDMGLLAALGIHQVPVFRKPRIALLSSGDELAAPGETLTPGKIYDSNSYTLTALIQQSGADVIALGVARDDPNEVSRLLQSAATQGADLILTSAGVSVGAFDYVRAILEQQGSLNFWRVNVRPGKPLAFGSFQNIPLIGLPGNPVSAFVSFLLFVAPTIRRLCGLSVSPYPQHTGVLDEALDSDGRESYLRGTTTLDQGKYHLKLAKNQSSANIYALVHANALLIVPSGVKSLPVGSQVKFIRIGDEGE